MSSAPLSLIYKTIRKDLKVNGKRVSEKHILSIEDEISIYMDQDSFESYSKKPERKRAKKQFAVIYEDDNLLFVDKPFGLLTHGDAREKKNHLANQVVDYLIEEGSYNPRTERTFTPAPANRIDRNTTGLVVFGKNAEALREMNRIIRERSLVSKHYLALVKGRLNKELSLRDQAVKDRSKNQMSLRNDGDAGLEMVSYVRPIASKKGYSLVEVEILTGRTHQIRVQLAKAGFPILGDPKYGDKLENSKVKKTYGVEGQLLHSWKMSFGFNGDESLLRYMDGKTIQAPLPERFMGVLGEVFDREDISEIEG